MTKKDIVHKISTEMKMSQTVVHEIVQRTLDQIVEAMIHERRIELRNFGVFEVKVRAARKARNPRTNEHLQVPERLVVTFKPGKEMTDRVTALDPSAALGDRFREQLSESPAESPPPPAVEQHPQPDRRQLGRE